MNSATPPAHPGVILLEKAMKPLGVSRNKLARDIDVPVGRISDIVGGKRGISPDTALRLAKYFGTSAEMWMRLQWEYDLYVARVTVWPKIDPRVRVFEPVDDSGHRGVRTEPLRAPEPVLPDLPDPVLPGAGGSVAPPPAGVLSEPVDEELAEFAIGNEDPTGDAEDEAVDGRELELVGVDARAATPARPLPTPAEPIGFALAQVAEAAAVAVTTELLRESRNELREMLRAPAPAAAPELQPGPAATEIEPSVARLYDEPVEPRPSAAPGPRRDGDVLAPERRPEPTVSGPAASIRSAAASDEPAEPLVAWPAHDDTNGYDPVDRDVEEEGIEINPAASQSDFEANGIHADDLGVEGLPPTTHDDRDDSEVSVAEASYELVPPPVNGHLDPALPAAIAEEPLIPRDSDFDAADGAPLPDPPPIMAVETHIDDDGPAARSDAAFRPIDDAFGPATPALAGDAEPPLLDEVDDDEPLLLTEEMPSLDIPDPDDPRFRARRDGD
jgi:addiction module HigA family antidote